DDRAVALFLHLRHHGADHLIGADDIDSVNLEEIGPVQRLEIARLGGLGLAGAVDERVDPAPALDRGGGHGAASLVVGDVGLVQEHIDAATAAGGGGLLGLGAALRIVDHDAAPSRRQQLRALGADASGGARDDGDAVLDVHASTPLPDTKPECGAARPLS